jgi:hypothetical protein
MHTCNFGVVGLNSDNGCGGASMDHEIVNSDRKIRTVERHTQVLIHRLTSLEAALTEKSSQELLSRNAVNARLQKIRDLKSQLEQTKNILQTKPQQDFLPPEFAALPMASQQESEILIQSLWERQALVRFLTQIADKAIKILQESLRGKNPALQSTFRLSKIGKWIAEVDARLKNTMLDDKSLSRLIRKTLGKSAPQEVLQLNHILVKTFSDLNRLEGDINRLQLQGTTLEKQIDQKRKWLDAERQRLDKAGPQDFAFDWQSWPTEIDTPLLQAAKAEQETKQIFQMAHQYQSISQTKMRGPVTKKIIREGKIG